MVPEDGLEPSRPKATDFELTPPTFSLFIFNNLTYNTIILIQHYIQH